MAQTRRPRFQRSREVPPIQLTDRDRNIIRQIYRHRFLRSSHIVALVGGSRQQVLRRLHLLFHHGYVERPRCQIDYYHVGGSREIVYGLNNRGAAHLKHVEKVPVRGFDWNERNRSVRRQFLEHALMVSDFIVALELNCRQLPNVSFYLDEEISLPEDTLRKRKPFQWTVQVRKTRVGVILPGQNKKPERILFCLEADRGTMPISRRSDKTSSFERKLLSYSATLQAGIHRSKFGVNRLRVITVAPSFERVNHLREVTAQIAKRSGLFVFSTVASIAGANSVLSDPVWLAASVDEPLSLFDQADLTSV